MLSQVKKLSGAARVWGKDTGLRSRCRRRTKSSVCFAEKDLHGYPLRLSSPPTSLFFVMHDEQVQTSVMIEIRWYDIDDRLCRCQAVTLDVFEQICYIVSPPPLSKRSDIYHGSTGRPGRSADLPRA